MLKSSSLGGFFYATKKRAELENLEKQISEPEFWNDSEKAQKVVQERSRVERALQSQGKFETAISDAGVLVEFAETDANSARELNDLIVNL
jgi:peptide chain release factor 2